MVQPWAKAYPLCRPPEPNNKEDARRFAREFPEACGEVDAEKDHMVSEVLNHMHPGGTDPAAPVPAGAAAIAKSLKRKRKTAALVLKYAAPEATNPVRRCTFPYPW